MKALSELVNKYMEGDKSAEEFRDELATVILSIEDERAIDEIARKLATLDMRRFMHEGG